MDHPRPGLRYVDADDLDKSTFDFDGLDVVDPSGEKLGEVDGFIIDINQARPYHVVVEGGHWYKHKHFLLPVGHVALDSSNKRLTTDVPKARAERIPGFSRGEFEKLTDADMDRMAQSTAGACCDEALDTTSSWDTWKDYAYPTWWEASYYRIDRGDMESAGSGSRAASGASGSGMGTMSTGGTSTRSSDMNANRDRDRELVTASGGDSSPHAGGRAQPGDVVGVETGGETTHIGDTAKDENDRRRDAEKSAAKSRD